MLNSKPFLRGLNLNQRASFSLFLRQVHLESWKFQMQTEQRDGSPYIREYTAKNQCQMASSKLQQPFDTQKQC